MTGLHVAYLLNLVILVPIALPTLAGADVAQGRFDESSGWRTLTGSWWTAILVCSALGMWRPEPFAVVLVLQLVYKAVWLATWALPRARAQGIAALPPGITLSFVGIVAAWPFLIPWGRLMGW